MRWLLLVVLSLFLQGCIPPSHIPEGSLTYKRVLDLISIPGASGFGTFYVKSDKGDTRGQAFLVASSDGRLRVDVVDPFLRPMYTILYREGNLTLLSIRDKRLYRRHLPLDGDISVGGMSFNPLSGMALVLGYPPLMDATIEEGRVADHLYHLRLREHGFVYEVTVDLKSGHPRTFVVYDRKGRFLYSQRNTFSKDGLLSTVKGERQGMVIEFRYSQWEVREPGDMEFLSPAVPSP